MHRTQLLPRRPARSLSGLLVLALLLAQLLGLAHRSLHEWDSGAAPASGEASSLPQARASGLASLLQAMLGEHADEGSCRLYDHAASGDAGLAAALALTAPPVAELPGWTPRPAPAAAPATAFHARAPPVRG